MECIEEVVENYVNLHDAIADDPIILFNSHDTFEIIEYIDFIGVDNFSYRSVSILFDTINWMKIDKQNIQVERLAVKTFRNWRIFKYLKYLFLWSGRFQFEDKQSLFTIFIQESINSRVNFLQHGENDADKEPLKFMELWDQRDIKFNACIFCFSS